MRNHGLVISCLGSLCFVSCLSWDRNFSIFNCFLVGVDGELRI